MYLVDLKRIVDSLEDRVYDFGIDDVFSWRGSYDEVAFSIGRNVSKEQMLQQINTAMCNEFRGWKGGEYFYEDYTTVNFEQEPSAYSDSGYITSFLVQHSDSDFGKALSSELITRYKF